MSYGPGERLPDYRLDAPADCTHSGYRHPTCDDCGCPTEFWCVECMNFIEPEGMCCCAAEEEA